MSNTLMFLFLLMKGFPNEARQNVSRIEQKIVLENCFQDASQKHRRRLDGDAWRDPSLNHALLLPPGGVQGESADQSGEAEDSIQCR